MDFSIWASKLPTELKNNILEYDKHFKIRKGIAVGVIPRDDYRYRITYKKNITEKNVDEHCSTYDVDLGKNLHLLLHYFRNDDSYIFSFVKRYELLHYDVELGNGPVM